jgi:hypothetical protein
MVRTVPTGRGPETVEVSPGKCPEGDGGRMLPYFTGCDSPTQRPAGHRYWICERCDLRLIDADCDCTTPGRRWPDPGHRGLGG